MSLPKLEKLTAEQEALIPVYREKWRAIATSTEQVEPEEASAAVKAAYATINRPEPNIVFYYSPYTTLKTANTIPSGLVGRPVEGFLRKKLNELSQQVFPQVQEPASGQVGKVTLTLDKLKVRLRNPLRLQVRGDVYYNRIGRSYWIHPEQLAAQCALLDFYISVLNCTHESTTWEAFQSLIKNCGWIYPYTNICFVCDRPTQISFDSEQRLHAEGEPAIQFADGYSLYAYHGVTLPEKYGAVHPREWQAQWYLQEKCTQFRQLLLEVLPPHQWQTQWILEENNAELRRILIQGIGYERICQELQATELDFWQEYTLLRIDNVVDVEPIHLLKMICPSTGFIHAMRVPPNLTSAREAIAWVNWGVDPEEFSVQT